MTLNLCVHKYSVGKVFRVFRAHHLSIMPTNYTVKIGTLTVTFLIAL